jgi:hypothetical protein
LQEKGIIFENFVFYILREALRDTSGRIYFWRTKDGAEVDFVVDFGKAQLPVEVKYRSLRKIEISRSFRNFIEKYHPKKAFIIGLDSKQVLSINKTKIHLLPYYQISEAVINGF